ncbi:MULTISPECIES: BON domain-containing protein [Calothrix]|uniref:BON domain-containing protein n=2 Tax=Calothrix TaxID=1186 RepID=A0ABR8A552_9CYAN|nr:MULTISPECIES: BON domain-containing protein [Calothrix]MBD2194949.1 BON domain-containing protein [Calothrix parietina FACHB-288]MBD2223547.1 BON domain-containing protein [Calothrix anomala FACHB-343]
MGWLQRLFGMEKPENAQVNPEPTLVAENSAEGETIPIERMGLNGEYDQSGLAKRVALAFDEDRRFDSINTIYVAQLGTKVVLRGKVPDADTLSQLAEVAAGVSGATEVATNEVTVG